ncbi:glutathione transferase GstA [Zavarzinia compransoris]|uniref:glutathione transferase GstA n=1 Tax=Zavarzinia marina TaxID=2911065 RepID=UPI001F256D64|nr:glutathione transferase GstA [Zavarzinia marina]MCF4165785.1 glutathione transferase GstA [Zavarzinia marina]
MDLYFCPMTCSLATRIALYESGQDARFHQVALSDKTIVGGGDYLAVNPKGQVPALRLDDGHLLTEGPAILQYVADRAPDSKLAPSAGSLARYEVQAWLNYVAAEVHKQVFYVIFSPESPEAARDHARTVLAPRRFGHLQSRLADREFLATDDFSVADAYLTTTLNWTRNAGIDLKPWPAVTAYHKRMTARPAVARAIAEEMALR